MHKEDVKARAITALENIVFEGEIPRAREGLFTAIRFVRNCSAATDFGIAENRPTHRATLAIRGFMSGRELLDSRWLVLGSSSQQRCCPTKLNGQLDTGLAERDAHSAS